MELVIKVKNAKTAADTWVGQEIQPGDYYEIQSNEKQQWQNDAQVLSDIEKGNLVVNDGYIDLFPDDGILRLEAETDSPWVLFSDSSFHSKTVKDAISEAADQCRGIVGFSLTWSFSKQGYYYSDVTMDYQGVSSGSRPVVVPFDVKLRGISFSNSSSNADADVTIEYGHNKPPVIMKVRGAKTVFLVEDVVINQGSLLTVWLQNKGIPAENALVEIYAQVISEEYKNFQTK
jgi:hypothetical protein